MSPKTSPKASNYMKYIYNDKSYNNELVKVNPIERKTLRRTFYEFGNKDLEATQEAMSKQYPIVNLRLYDVEEHFFSIPVGSYTARREAPLGMDEEVGDFRRLVQSYSVHPATRSERARSASQFWDERHKVRVMEELGPVTIGVKRNKAYVLGVDGVPLTPGFDELLLFEDERIVIKSDDELYMLTCEPNLSMKNLKLKHQRILKDINQEYEPLITVSRLEKVYNIYAVDSRPATLEVPSPKHPENQIEPFIQEEFTDLASTIRMHPKRHDVKIKNMTGESYAVQLPEVTVDGALTSVRLTGFEDGSTAIVLSSSTDIQSFAQRIDEVAKSMTPEAFVAVAEDPDKVEMLRRLMRGRSASSALYQHPSGEIVVENSLSTTDDALERTDSEYLEFFTQLVGYTRAYLAAIDTPSETTFDFLSKRWERENENFAQRMKRLGQKIIDILMKLP